VQKFDLTHSPIICCNLDNTFTDISGNALHLTGVSPIFREVWPGLIGLVSGSANRGGLFDSLLRIYGDITIQQILVMRAAPSNGACIAFSGPGGSETEANNANWQVNLTSQNSPVFYCEYGAGLEASSAYSPSTPTRGLPALGVPFKLDFVKKNGIGQFYLNAVPYGPPSAVLTAPTGATTATLTVRSGGTNPPEHCGFKVNNIALTPAELVAEYNRTMGTEFGELQEEVNSLWVGGTTDDAVTVVAQLTLDSDDVRLVVNGASTTYYSASSGTTNRLVKLTVNGLDPDTTYTYQIESNGVLIDGPTGSFKTFPDSSQPASFKIAFSGDAWNGSNHLVFEEILNHDPLLFQHMGDSHYSNITTNSTLLFHAAYDEMLAQPRQLALYSNVNTNLIMDDHDYGGNNSNGSSPSRAASVQVYRERVPHYTLPDANGAMYYTYDIGSRVRVVVTDQRSAASANSATDNSSKTMLGTDQKNWFKNILSNSAGKLIVWVCPRWFGVAATSGADHWGGFSTERQELADYIKANCHGRVIVLSADLHTIGVDDGANHDFATGGGEPLPTFQCAALDIAPVSGGQTYSHGEYLNIGQFGTMEVVDSGGSTIDVTWKGWDSLGNLLVTCPLTITV
jgi:hypothetical protein